MGRRRGNGFVVALATLLAGAAPPAAAQQDTMAVRAAGEVLPTRSGDRPTHAIARARGAIAVDGRLDDAGWDGAAVIPLTFEVSPGENRPAAVRTECRMAYDGDALFLGCDARDPDPGAIRAFVVDRDGIDGHDRVVLTLDPFDDQRRGFQFGVSALGVQYDAVLAQQGTGGPDGGDPDAEPVDPAWDAIWNSAGRITENGFVVEAAIPFDALRFPRADGPATWGFYLSRSWPRSVTTELRSVPLDRADACGLCQAARLTGLEGVRPGRNVELNPTFTASRTDTRAVQGAGLVDGGADPEFGLDARWGITSNLTLNLTANPDFSQVEADVAQLDVNNQFALFFPERRPFFLEGADFFGTPIQAVFTRSISDPVGGAKVTGKLGDYGVGLLAARDAVTNVLIPGTERSHRTRLDASSTTLVGRVRGDLGASSTVGALATSREGSGYHNRVAGVDALYRPVRSVTLQGQVLRSHTRYPDVVVRDFDQRDGGFGGTALRGSGNWTTRHWMADVNASRTGSGFRADAGFVNQAGRLGGNVNVRRRWWGGSDTWFSQIRAQVGTWHSRDFDGNQLNGGFWTGLEYYGPGQTYVGFWPNVFMGEYFAGTAYEGLRQYYFSSSASPLGSLTLAFGGDWGDRIDYANERLGRQLTLRPAVTWRVGRNTDLDLQHSWQRLTRDGGTVFSAQLTQLRAVYNFSTRSYVRAVVQYRRTDRNPDRYVDEVDERTQSVFTQLLYSYKVNPRTVLFAGYADDRDGWTDPDGRHTPLSQRGRTFFLKLGYAFQP